MSVRDARGRTWRVKWGDEVTSESFAVSVVWAASYHVEAAYYVAEGRIEGAKDLTRARVRPRGLLIQQRAFRVGRRGRA